MKMRTSHNTVLYKSLTGLKNARVGVGWFEDSKYKNDKNGDIKIGDVAMWQEYGTARGIPQRPFMRPAKMKNYQKWLATARQQIAQCIEQGKPLTVAMKGLGLVVKGDIQQAIRDVMEPPLKPATIANRLRRKKSKEITDTITKPLIDTGVMLGAVGAREEEC